MTVILGLWGRSNCLVRFMG